MSERHSDFAGALLVFHLSYRSWIQFSTGSTMREKQSMTGESKGKNGNEGVSVIDALLLEISPLR